MLTPLTHYLEAGSSEARELGKKRIQNGEVGALILAGGQGTRLGLPGPKGKASVNGKTLFQRVFEKTKTASEWAREPLFIAIMTSPLNHQETLEYLEENHYFGLDPGQCFLFMQEMLPFLDEQKQETPEKGPNGNGEALKLLVKSGIWEKWRAAGVQRVHVVPVDNPLADPFDAELAGYEADVILKAITRRDPSEKVGVIAMREDKLHVIEYSEIDEKQRELPWKVAHTGLLSFSMEFIRKAAEVSLPLHLAKKGNFWKREYFLFDVLPHAEKSLVIVYPREQIFAPLKNRTGEDSFDTVSAALK